MNYPFDKNSSIRHAGIFLGYQLRGLLNKTKKNNLRNVATGNGKWQKRKKPRGVPNGEIY